MTTEANEVFTRELKAMLAPILEAANSHALVTGIVIGLLVESGALSNEQIVARIEATCTGMPERQQALLAMIQAAVAPRQ